MRKKSKKISKRNYTYKIKMCEQKVVFSLTVFV